tara:strand:+ start:383 stop:1033 length:651 start_codon:yes stop_codon:yes gene_type:complete
MKRILFIFLLCVTTSCASIDTNRIAPGYVEAFSTLKQLLIGVENDIDPEIIKSIPYASMLVRFGNGPTALMILESKVNDNYSWVSADGVYLIINNGRIIKTHGLNNNLTEKLMNSINWKDDLYNGQKFISYNSFKDPDLNNLKVSSTYIQKGYEEVTMTFNVKKLKLIEEVMVSKEVGWKETNRYWLDEANFVWKSVQNISPRLPEVYIEVTKKPR